MKRKNTKEENKRLAGIIFKAKLQDLGGQKNGISMAFRLFKTYSSTVVLYSMQELRRQMEKQKIDEPYSYFTAICKMKDQDLNFTISYEEHKNRMKEDKATAKSTFSSMGALLNKAMNQGQGSGGRKDEGREMKNEKQIILNQRQKRKGKL